METERDKRMRRSIEEALTPRLPPSQVGARGIARPRLIEQLKLARDRRCIVLQGPAGCGKTTVLGAWRRELVAAGTEVAWVALDDDDGAHFVDALFAALSGIDNAIVRDATILAERGDGQDTLEGIAIALVRGIAAHRHPVALVFDDVHHVRDERVIDALQLLLDYGSPNLLCLFASRNPLPLSLGRLRAQDQLLELGLSALRFTREESSRLVAALLEDVDESQANSLHELTDGWVAGLKLLCLDLRRKRDGANKPLGERVRDARTFARYFEQEVLSRLSHHDLRFVVRCALLEYFNAALCAALQGGEFAVSASAELLARLESQGLFLVAADARYPDGWWRLHPLLRDVLLTHVDALPEAERRTLHTIAWKWFSAHGMQHDAVHHALKAEDAGAAADLVEGCAAELFAQGELRRLVGLVRQLPDSIVRERAGLRLWMAWVQVYERRLPECGRSIARLQHDLAQAAPAVRYRLTLLRGLYAVQCDDTAAAMTILPELLDVPEDADAIALTGRRNLLTWIYLYRGEYEKARFVQLGDAPPFLREQPPFSTPFGVLAGRCLVGLTHAVEGQMIQAERIYRDVLYEAERRGAGCADAGCLAAGMLAEVLYELNDPMGAMQLLEAHLEILEHVSMPDTVLRVMLVMGRAHWLAGRPLEAIAYVEHIQDYAERMGLDRLCAYSLLMLVMFHLQRDASGLGCECMAALDALDARHAGAEAGTVSEIHVAAERARIIIDMHEGKWLSARRRLSYLEALCLRRGRARRIPCVRIQMAVVERRLGREDKVKAHMREALRAGHQLGLVRTLLDAHADAPGLIRESAADLADDYVLGFYAERLEAASRSLAQVLQANEAPVERARPAMPVEALSPREAEIVQLLLQAMSNKKIARILNLSLDTVKWHLKNCYGKLGVSGRDEIIERMRDVDAG